MVTPDGYLYSREALLENLLQQKKAIKKKLAAYEAQQQDEQQKVRLPWMLSAPQLRTHTVFCSKPSVVVCRHP